MASSVSENSRRLSALILWMIRSSDSFACVRSWNWLLQARVASFEIVQFVERFHVHGADVADLAFERGDFLLDRLALLQAAVARLVDEFRDLQAVVLAQAIGQASCVRAARRRRPVPAGAAAREPVPVPAAWP